MIFETPQRLKFLGEKLKTPKGGTLTVVGIDKDVRFKKNKMRWNDRYILECSICSNDKELYPKITSTKSDLLGTKTKKPKIPCGCAINPVYNKAQVELLVNRGADKLGYEFLGWVDGYISKRKSKVILKKKGTNFIWNTSNADSIIRGVVGDKETAIARSKLKKIKPAEEYIKLFIEKSSYPKGTTFTRTGPYNDKWEVFCSVCNYPVVVDRRSIVKGCLACSCSRRGFDKETSAFLYITLWSHIGDNFVKIGVTNRDVHKRISEQQRKTQLSFEKIHLSVVLTGKYALKLERDIKVFLTQKGGGNIKKSLMLDGYTETFKYESNLILEELTSIVDQYLKVLV